MNKVLFTGRLAADPELRHTASNIPVVTVDMALTAGYGDKKKTHFPTLVLWRKQAEYISQYGHKGDWVEVEGRYTERKWEDKNGNKRKSVEIEVDQVSVRAKPASDEPQQKNADGDAYSEFTEFKSDDNYIPF